MSYTQQDLTNIKQAIATGELSVERNGSRVQFRTIDELLRAKREIEADLQAQGTARPAVTYAQFERD